MKNKKAISKMSKTLIVLQLILVVGGFMFIYFFSPHLDYPKNNQTFDSSKVDFRFRNANVILIDNNPDFRNASEIDIKKTNMTSFNFRPGTYYWKAVGLIESNPNVFTVNSNVGLELSEENSSIINVGNVPLNINEKSSSGISGLAILDIQVEYPVDISNKSVYQGAEYEK